MKARGGKIALEKKIAILISTLGRFNRANKKICHVHFKGAKLDSKIGLYFTHRNCPIFRAKADLSDLQCTMDHF